MDKLDKFVIGLIVISILASEGIIPQQVPEDYIRDQFGLNFLEDMGNYSSQADTSKPMQYALGITWIFFKHFWLQIIIGAVYVYVKRKYF